MPPPRRVVVTGLGLLSPLGVGAAANRDAVLAGKSGVARLTSYDPSALSVRIGGEIPDFDARPFVDKKDRKSLKHMARTVQIGVVAARLALDDAGIAAGSIDPDRLGVAYGTGTIPGRLEDLSPPGRASFDRAANRVDLAKWGTDGIPLLPPMWLLNHVPNMAACNVAILNDARGPNNTITQSDVASLLAIGEAVRVIRRGDADVMLAGGADTRVDLLSMFRCPLFIEMSRRNDDPAGAVRPFDATRDGTAIGEGGGVLVLEDLEHAQRRGATIVAEVVGFASGFDRGRTCVGLTRVIRQAMAAGGATPGEIDHVNASAPGTVADDAREARGIRGAVGDVPTVAFKPSLSHLGAGADAADFVLSLLAMRHGTLPGTLNHREPDPACPVVVNREPRPVRQPFVLKTGGTEIGQCGAVVVRRWG